MQTIQNSPPPSNNMMMMSPSSPPPLPPHDDNLYGSNSSPPLSPKSLALLDRECDYDTSPTALYQAIEARRWDHVLQLLEEEGNDEVSIWVIRKEHNGRLRWRLLPIHAAIIFQAPNVVVEELLTAYPAGAAVKDDQGMLPLHLAFRNQPVNWFMVEDLLTAHPAAVFVKDRKGRTPLAGGLAAANAAASSQVCQQQQNRLLALYRRAESNLSASLHNNNGANSTSQSAAAGGGGGGAGNVLTLSPSSQYLATTNSLNNATLGAGDSDKAMIQHVMEEHKVALTVLDLYTSIVLAGEKTRWKQHGHHAATDTTMEENHHHHHPPQYWRQQMAALAEQHAQRLTELRDAFAREQAARQERHIREIQFLKRKLERKRAKILEEEEAIELVEAITSGLLSKSDISETEESEVPARTTSTQEGDDDAEFEPAHDESPSPSPSPGKEVQQKEATTGVEEHPEKVNDEVARRENQCQALQTENNALRQMVRRLLQEQQKLTESIEQQQVSLDQEARRVLAQQQMLQHEQVKAWKERCDQTRENWIRQLESLSTIEEEHLPPTASNSTSTTFSRENPEEEEEEDHEQPKHVVNQMKTLDKSQEEYVDADQGVIEQQQQHDGSDDADQSATESQDEQDEQQEDGVAEDVEPAQELFVGDKIEVDDDEEAVECSMEEYEETEKVQSMEDHGEVDEEKKTEDCGESINKNAEQQTDIWENEKGSFETGSSAEAGASEHEVFGGNSKTDFAPTVSAEEMAARILAWRQQKTWRQQKLRQQQK